MLRFWDFECPTHGRWEVIMDQAPPDAIYCPDCNTPSPRVWVHAPRVAGREKGVYPYFDVQLGKQIEDKKHHDAVLAQKGLVRESFSDFRATEYHRTAPPDEVLDAKSKAEFRECALKAYHDVETREIPLETHPSVEATEAIPIITQPKE